MRHAFASALLLFGLLAGAANAAEPGSPSQPPLPLQVADPARRAETRLSVRNLSLRCAPDSSLDTDVILSTLGTEYEQGGEMHFLPVLSLAYDRELHGGEELEWLALWTLGRQPTGVGDNLRAALPLSAGKRSLDWQPPAARIRLLKQLQAGDADWSRFSAPAPDLDLGRLGRPSYTGLVTSSIRRTLDWAGVFNPARFLYRTWLYRRRDLRDRRFQETYQGLVWYLDAVDSTGLAVPQQTMAEIKFHLIRNRSTFAPWVAENQFLESSWAYDSARRQRTISVSSTLMTAANEYRLGFEEFHQPVVNGTPTPVGALLYYDPVVAPAPSEVRWDSPNLFDLRYNPFTDRRVQEFAQQHPGQRIPLALYSYYAVLPRKPVILVDFFDPENPRKREAAAVRMTLLREFLSVAEIQFLYWGVYRPVTYIANKKAFTPLANRVPAMGVEEFRLLLRNRLLFEPALADSLLRRVDRRELNPLMPAAETQRLNAEINYLLLSGNHGANACEAVEEVRRRLFRESTGREVSTLTSEQWRTLEPWLDQRRALRHLGLLAESDQTWEQLRDDSEPSLRVLEVVPPSSRLPTRSTLLNFERRLLEEQARLTPPVPAELEALRQRVERLLARAYDAEGRPAGELERELSDLQRKVMEERRQRETRLAKQQKKRFENTLKKELKWLAQLQAKPDLRLVSGWRIEQAVDFLTGAPEIATRNPILKSVLARYQKKIEQALAATEQLLSRRVYDEEVVETSRLRCLELLSGARLAPRAAGTPPQPAAHLNGEKRRGQ